MPNTGERRFKRGQIICKPGEMDMNMYNILYGSVAVYKDYGTPEEVEVVTLSEGDFFNVISFLESRPRNTTVVALEPLVVSEITMENFGKYFSERPAKIMSLLQHMSARIRQLQKAYVETCHALEAYSDKERLQAQHSKMVHYIEAMFPYMLGKTENDEEK